MYYQVSKEFFDKLPNACFGAVAVRGLDNTHEIPELEQMLAENVAACETYFAGKKPKETEDILPYRAAFTENGVIKSDRQCEYVRAIAFALLGEDESKAAAETLNQMVIENGCHLNTGFLSTPFLCDVLAKYGYADTAYKLLLQPDAPGWLYEVGKGATTVWETWTGIDENGKPHDSLNHYSYGAICGWLFGGVCGIRYADGALTIAPTPDKSLGWAKAAYDSPAGRIVSGWRYDGDAVTYEFEIPANLTADVTLPDGRKLTLAPGKHTV